MEKWRDIIGFEGIYQISDMGRLKSFKDNREGRILSNVNKKGGYFSVILQCKELRRSARIHRLVAEAFIPNPNNLPQINHIDGNKQNNCFNNLEWVSRKGNVQHAIKHNPNIIKGMNNYNRFIRPKSIQQYSLDNKLKRRI